MRFPGRGEVCVEAVGGEGEGEEDGSIEVYYRM